MTCNLLDQLFKVVDKSEILMDLNESMLDIAKKAQRFHKIKAREFCSHVIAISRKDADKVKKCIQEFTDELFSMIKDSKPEDSIYAVNFQFFPFLKQ